MASAEQRAALTIFRGLVDPRLRVTADAEGWPVVPGRYGRIEWHTADTLAAFTDRPRIARRLRGVTRPHQVGSEEFRGLFAPAALAQVAALLGARKRRFGGRSAADMAVVRAARRTAPDALTGATSDVPLTTDPR